MLQSPSPSTPVSTGFFWPPRVGVRSYASCQWQRRRLKDILRFPIRFSMNLRAFRSHCKDSLAKACQSVKQIFKFFLKRQGANVRNDGISAVFLNAGAKAMPLRQGPPCPVRPLRLNAFSLENMLSFIPLFRFQSAGKFPSR